MTPGKRSCRWRPHGRAGFSLIELLIVVTIIGILLALTASAAVQVIGGQRKSNTEQVVKTIADHVDRVVQAVIAEANREVIPPSVITFAGDDHTRARVIWIKLRLKQEFPMNFYEALYPAIPPRPMTSGRPQPPEPCRSDPVFMERMKALPVFSTVIKDSDVARNPGDVYGDYVPDAYESSVCLLLALQQGRGGISFNADNLGSNVFDSFPLPPPDQGDPPDPRRPARSPRSFKALVDAWGKPLRFYRWPTANMDQELNAGGARPGYNDSLDPTGLLCTATWLTRTVPPNFNNQPLGQFYRELLHNLPAAGNPPRSFKLSTVVLSTGANKRLGISLPNNSRDPDPMNTTGANRPDEASDNIYSYRLR